MAEAPDTTWTARVEALLALADHGTVVLVDRAHDSHIGDLVRALMGRWPLLGFAMDADELSKSSPGSTVVLDLSDDDRELTALNLVRPVLRDRGLRVAVWARDGVAAKLAKRAPDFFDWISHRVEAPPPRPYPFVVQTMLAAEHAGRPITWRGSVDALRDAVAHAWPERNVVTVTPDDYDALVDAIAASAQSAVIVNATSGGTRRARWALAEARRYSRVGIATREHLSGYWELPGHGADRDRLLGLSSVAMRLMLCRRDLEFSFDLPHEGTQWRHVAQGRVPPHQLREWGASPEAIAALRMDDPEDQLALVVATHGSVDGPLMVEAEVERLLWRGDPSDLPTLSMLAAELGEYDAAIRWERRRGKAPHWMRISKATARLAKDGPVEALEALVVDEPPAEDSPARSRWHALRARILADQDSIGEAREALAVAGHDAANAPMRAYVRVVCGDFRVARVEASAVRDIAPLSHVELESLLVAVWACDVERSAIPAQLEDERHPEMADVWRPWARLLGVPVRPPAQHHQPLRQAVVEYARAETARGRGNLAAALRSAARGRWVLAKGVAPGEHHLEGFLELTRGRALARMGHRMRAVEALAVAEGIIGRTTKNTHHPFALVARFERAWIMALDAPDAVPELDAALAALAAALWPEHREVRAAHELRASIR